MYLNRNFFTMAGFLTLLRNNWFVTMNVSDEIGDLVFDVRAPEGKRITKRQAKAMVEQYIADPQNKVEVDWDGSYGIYGEKPKRKLRPDVILDAMA